MYIRRMRQTPLAAAEVSGGGVKLPRPPDTSYKMEGPARVVYHEHGT